MKLLFLLVLAEFASGQAMQTGSSQPPEKRLALVIGNGAYNNGTARSTAVNDASDVAALLTNRLGFEVLLHTNVNKAAMQRAISEFSARCNDYRVSLFYYAGYGIQSGGEVFMLPTDANPTHANELNSMCLSVGQFTNKTPADRSKISIVLLDTDRDSPFERTVSRSTTSFRDLDTPIGSVIAYATSPGKAVAKSNGRNGFYAAALLKEMIVPNQSLIQTFRNVRMDVLKQSGGRQIPWEATSLTEDFYLLRK